MKPMLRARLQSRCSRGFTLACDDDATIRIVALARSREGHVAARGRGAAEAQLVRARPRRVRHAVGGPRAARRQLMARSRRDEITTEATHRSRHAGDAPDGAARPPAHGLGVARRNDIRPRPRNAAVLSRPEDARLPTRDGAPPGDRYYGLGDKTGPLDLHGRRLRCAMSDSLGFDPRARRSALQALAVPDRARRRERPFAAASSTTTGAEDSFDLGCEHDNYFGRYRRLRGRGRRPRLLVFPRPAPGRRHRRNSSR